MNLTKKEGAYGTQGRDTQCLSHDGQQQLLRRDDDLFDATRAINSVKDGKATISAADLQELRETFELFLFDILGMKDEASAAGSSYEAFGKAVDLLLAIRQQAKANKDWATSDKIRNELTAIGFEIKDTKEGAEWRLG